MFLRDKIFVAHPKWNSLIGIHRSFDSLNLSLRPPQKLFTKRITCTVSMASPVNQSTAEEGDTLQHKSFDRSVVSLTHILYWSGEAQAPHLFSCEQQRCTSTSAQRGLLSLSVICFIVLIHWPGSLLSAHTTYYWLPTASCQDFMINSSLLLGLWQLFTLYDLNSIREEKLESPILYVIYRKPVFMCLLCMIQRYV